MKEKHFFAGNNTSEGFFSYFNYLINSEEAEHIYILKGGPGVGKSSFMKKFAEEMKKRNYFVEYIHCSNDDNSLDGILIPKLKILFVDGTAPHTVEPVIPGAVDEIINLDSFLDSEKIKKHKAAIMQTNKIKSNIYKSAYRYLEAAGIIHDEICSICDSNVDIHKFDNMSEESIYKLFGNSNSETNGKKKGSVRKLFTESFTANGYISYTELFFDDNEVWAVVGNDTNYSSIFLERILNEAVKSGCYVEGYYRALCPNKLQHIYLPEKKIIIVTAENSFNEKYNEIFDIHSLMNTENIKSQISEIEKNLHLYSILIRNSLEKLSETKKLHDLLEAFYINCMDFNGVNQYFEKIISNYHT